MYKKDKTTYDPSKNIKKTKKNIKTKTKTRKIAQKNNGIFNLHFTPLKNDPYYKK